MNHSGRSWVWPVLVVTLSALTLGLMFAHVLELPPRLDYSAEVWTALTERNALYQYFGVIGGPVEVAAVIGVIALAVVYRRQRPASRFALAAAVLHAAALAVWLAVVAPANAEIANWGASGIPADWETWRNQWEIGHSVRFALLLAGFWTLVLAVVARQHVPTSTAPGARDPLQEHGQGRGR